MLFFMLRSPRGWLKWWSQSVLQLPCHVNADDVAQEWDRTASERSMPRITGNVTPQLCACPKLPHGETHHRSSYLAFASNWCVEASTSNGVAATAQSATHCRLLRMSLAVVQSRSLLALDAPPISVEVHLANGLPSFTLVGLADTEVKESRERVRAALQNSGLTFPHNKRITVNLAPAELPKESGRFDLPIALGILAASGQIDAARLEQFEFAGELSLSGELRPVRGALALALGVRKMQVKRALILPMASAQEAALVDGVAVHAATHLLDVVRWLVDPGTGSCVAIPRALPLIPDAIGVLPDLRDVKGQSSAKRALEIAAAGSHSLLLLGPPGTGKSMLAQRFAGLLPPLTIEEALDSAAVLSLNREFKVEQWRQRVFRAPHHSSSSVALVGGGSPPRPGEVSLAQIGRAHV